MMAVAPILRRAAAPGVAAIALLLGGCAAMPGQTAVAPDATASAYQDSIDINGRLSVQYTQNDQPQSLHGSFIWSQTAKQTDLELLSPLGQTVATISVKPGLATLVESGKSPRVALNVDELAAQSLGWPLPVSGLRQWLQGSGTDSAGKPFQAKPGADDAAFITQDGWRVVYANWQTDPASGEARPKRIDLTRNTEQAGKVSIRIAVDSWKKP